MRKAIAIGLFLNAALVARILLEEEVIGHAAGGDGAPKGNGDVNGDGEIDISDAVHLLDGLFCGGPDPIPIVCAACDSCCQEEPVPGLPATGQMTCFDASGAGISCDSPDFPGQDGAYQAGCPGEDRFVDNLDGTVTDTCTGLMWQKDTADVSGNGWVGEEDLLNWQGALEYCDGLDFAGHTDWRLPNVRELESILDYGRYGLAIDPVFGAVWGWYWSSSSHAGDPSVAWNQYFAGGAPGQSSKDSLKYVRAVRFAP